MVCLILYTVFYFHCNNITSCHSISNCMGEKRTTNAIHLRVVCMPVTFAPICIWGDSRVLMRSSVDIISATRKRREKKRKRNEPKIYVFITSEISTWPVCMLCVVDFISHTNHWIQTFGWSMNNRQKHK